MPFFHTRIGFSDYASLRPTYIARIYSLIIVLLLTGVPVVPGCLESIPGLGDISKATVMISGPEIVDEGSTGKYILAMAFESGSSVNLAKNVIWSVASGPGSVDNKGIYTAPAKVEENAPVIVHATYIEGQTTKEAHKNITIKAKKIGKVLTGITISGPPSITEGESEKFTLMATYDNTTTIEIVAGITWTLEGDGSVSPDGTVTAPTAISEDTPAVLTAAYKESGVTKNTTKSVLFTRRPLRKITGQVLTADKAGVAGIIVVANPGGNTDTTDTSGTYRITVANRWSGTVTPESPDYTFDPASRSYTSITADQTGQNFTAAHGPVKITGRVLDMAGVGIANIVVAAEGTNNSSGQDATDTTIADGSFTLTVPYGWTGVVRAQSASYTFTPSSRTFTNMAQNQADQNFSVVVDQPPTVATVSVSLDQDTSLDITLTGSDPEGKDLTFAIVTAPSHGTLGAIDNSTISTATVKYTPAIGYKGTDSFTFKCNDGTQDSSPSAVTITVNPVNHPPVASSQAVMATTGQPTPITLAGSDPDGDTLTFAVVTPPANGALTGTPPDLTYTAAGGFTGSDSFTFTTSDGELESSPATVTITISGTTPPPTTEWVPPIGIPAPSFGIAETHKMYEGKTYNYSTGTGPYKDAGFGPYTHYVDNTKTGATDSGNPYGTPEKPRMTIPSTLAAGSVVEVHGGPYPNAVNLTNAIGTASQPVFVRGADPVNRPLITAKVSVYNNSTYVIVENLGVTTNALSSGVNIVGPAHHVAVRNLDVSNCQSAIIMWGNSGATLHDIVIYRNASHDNGLWQNATGDRDWHGMTCTQYADHIWFLDNEMYHNEGDGLQVNGGTIALRPYTHHIYIGRNNSHHNKQTGLWVKHAENVVFSQNVLYGHRQSTSAMGAGTGFQYGPKNVWFLGNNIYDNEIGVMVGSSNDSREEGHYFIGNLIHNIHTTKTYDVNDSYHVGQAFVMWGYGTKHIVNNTIYDCDGGISFSSTPNCVIVNNIIAGIKPGTYGVFLENATTAASAVLQNNIFSGDFNVRLGTGRYTTLDALRTATGKGQNCIVTDPLFVNPTTGDFHLQTNSPAVDIGATSDVYSTFQTLYGIDISKDLEGKARPQGAGFDVGAFECR